MTEVDETLSNLEAHVQRQDAEAKAAEALAVARCKLVLAKDANKVFFSTLALKLRPQPDWFIPTLCTDGRLLRYNPAFVNSLSPDEVLGVNVHECMHPMLKHHTRRGAREHRRYNIAADLAINPLLREAGFVLPECGLFPGKDPYQNIPTGPCTEAIYDLIQPGDGDGPGGGSDPGGCGGVEDAAKDGDPAGQAEAEAEADVNVAQAHQAAKLAEAAGRGRVSAGISRLVGELLAPKVDWRNVLREFVTRFARNDYTWSPPNRRHVWQGLYLPGLRSEEMGDIVVAVDTSGSINAEVLRAFGSEIQGILDGYDCTCTILYCDADIKHTQTWRSTDGPLVLEAKGGGGTSHIPVFAAVDKMPEKPACVVCLTDLYTDFPSKAPDYPVLWCVFNGPPTPAPFGQTIKVD